MPVRTQTVTAGPRRVRVGLARGVVVALLAAVGIFVAAQPAAAASATSLDAGASHTCVVVSGGTVSCWGYNNNGQLGDGSTTDSSTPVAVNTSGLPAGVTITQVSTGWNHTCALSAAGAVYCWGYNNYGQLGDDSTIDSSIPVAVITSGLPAGVTITQVSAGNSQACAVSSAGAVYCWGYNNYGQLGDASTANRHTPVAVDTSGVLAGVTITRISAGYEHTCAVSSAGAVYCWGNNEDGQLGNGGITNQSSPVAVTGLTGVTQVSAGGAHTCALTSAGAVYCWGRNNSGQLGNGNLATNQSSPVAVTGLTGVTQVSAGWNDTCALSSAGAVYCWGNNEDGQLGDGSIGWSSTPVAVTGLTGVTQISAGNYDTCAVSSAGAAYCWGRNNKGQLGDASTTERHAPVAVSALPTTPPGAPTGVTATAGNTQATVSWTTPSLGSGTLTGYTATASPGGATCTSTSTSCTITGLTVGTAYTFTVVTHTGDGNSGPSAASAAVVPYALPGAPTAVSATAGNGQATMSWTAPASMGTGTFTGYTATANPGGAACTTATTSCTITGLTNGTAYTFTVVTRSTAGQSAASAPSTAITPAVPDAPPLPDQVPAGDGTLTSSQGATLAPGSHTTLTGTGFAANTPVTIGIYSTPQRLTTVLTDSTGAFSTGVTVPAGYTGAHTLAAVGLGPDQATLRILALPITIAASSTGGLAVTGQPLTTAIGLALALLAIGAAAVITVRRRRPHFTADLD
jgi:alpha-tubulin suppressor-like RCC1 family protein